MSSKHGFLFNCEEIEQRINALNNLNEAIMYAQADDQDPKEYDEQAQKLNFYFECLADSLWEEGVFKSRQEARNLIRADIDVLERASGPDGLPPDDGILNPDEIAQGIVALRNLNEFVFQAPFCCSFFGTTDVDYSTHAQGTHFRVTSNYADLPLVKLHPELLDDQESKNYLWIEGSVKAHSYEVARAEIDLLLVSVMGMMEVIGLLRYRPWPRHGSKLSIGTKNHMNSGVYWDMRSVRMSQHLMGLYDGGIDNEMDRARTRQDRLEANLRLLGRAISDSSEPALAVRHACRMHLRSFESWNIGEAAMFLAITMEGLLLDKRQKDDLSARLQDSVAYWVGGSSRQRNTNRKCIAELYKIRSNYVHNGEDAPSTFDLDRARELSRRVIRKELLTLGSDSIT